MGIATHVATISTANQSNDAIASRRVVDDRDIPNTAGGPSLQDYIALEAASGYLVNLLSGARIVTANVADINSSVAVASNDFQVNKILAPGNYNFTSGITIPRISDFTFPTTYQNTNPSRPAGFIQGSGQDHTCLTFDPSITGTLVSTEGYASGMIGEWWNDASEAGKLPLCGARVQDLKINGNAQIHTYPQGQIGSPDLHGPDFVHRADGLYMVGGNLIARNLTFCQIPGYALRMHSGGGGFATNVAAVDTPITRASDIQITQAMYGFECNVGDGKFDNIYMTGIIKDGLVINADTVWNGVHIYGADRSIVCNSHSRFSNIYAEAARVGFEFATGSDGSNVTGLNIGPGTCWEKGVHVNSNSIKISDLFGVVYGADDAHTSPVGVYVEGSTGSQHRLSGSLVVNNGNSGSHISTGVVWNGTDSVIDLAGGWFLPIGNNSPNSTYMRFDTRPKGLNATFNFYGDDGIFLDFTNSGLDSGSNPGININATVRGTARIVYPSGGSTYNMVSGVNLTINGVLQHA